MTEKLKNHETIGCCGIDCGLCPKYYTNGDSACPGCGGFDFKIKHPSCGYLTCVIKKGLEVCSDCPEYPCKRFDGEKKGFDSFVTHKKVFVNLDNIKSYGIGQFIKSQKDRIEILEDLLSNYDDGRSKSFYCLSCALLPVDKLHEIQSYAHNLNETTPIKDKSKLIKNHLNSLAAQLNIELKLNNK
jgi:hypothetical protein